jgi:hypothetical protein
MFNINFFQRALLPCSLPQYQVIGM